MDELQLPEANVVTDYNVVVFANAEDAVFNVILT